MVIVPVVTALVAVYVSWTFICLESNVRKARAIGVPVIRQPIDSFNVLWLTVQNLIWAALDRLPIAWSSFPAWLRSLRRSWQFTNNNHWNLEHGHVFALVSPVGITLYIADADAISEIYRRRDDFIRPVQEYKILEIFGPCLSTAGWDDWPRHRKPLASPFNEGIMKFVWKESLRQAQLMTKSWTSDVSLDEGIPSTTKDMRTFSLNVLAGTGFGQSYDFHGSADGDSPKEGKTYRDALATVLDNCILLMLVPLRRLKSSWAPKRWRDIAAGAESFMGYMEQMVTDERSAKSQGKSNSGGIMTSFVHALDEYERHQTNKDPSLPDIPKNRRGLSMEELYSNLFVINFAGHDTTANTITFCVFSLAAHPQVQDWIADEIDAVIGDLPPEEWDYETLFPKLSRCRAVFWESLRLYPPVMSIPKWTAARQQDLTVQGKMLNIPAGTRTYIYNLAVQTLPQYWDNPLTWRPSRWIVEPKSGSDELGKETFLDPPTGTFLPWSSGAQNCPGKKFADVEAAALIAKLFQQHRVKVKLNEGESAESGCVRAQKCLSDVDCSLVLRMVDPHDTKLIYEKRP